MPTPQPNYLTLVALGISALSLVISALNVGWNIYRELKLRAQVRVSFGSREIHHPTFEKPVRRVVVSAVNHGPGIVKISMIAYKKASLWRRLTRRVENGVIIHDYTDPWCAKLPAKIEVGEGIDLMLGSPGKFQPSEGITHIGLNDTFGRTHWAPMRDVRELLASYKARA